MMPYLMKFLSTGRGFTVAVALTTLMSVAALWLNPVPLAVKLTGTLAVIMVGACFVLGVRELKKIRGEIKAFAQAGAPGRGAAFWGNAKSNRADTRTGDGGAQAPGYDAPSAELNYFAPARIPGTVIVDKPHAHAAGRQAADQIMAEDPERKYRQLFSMEEDELRPVVAYLGIPRSSLSEHCDVVELVPGYSSPGLNPNVSFVVVDEPTMSLMSWRGAMNAAHTPLFVELFDVISNAKRQGVVVVAIRGEDVSHFSRTLEDYADIVLRAAEMESKTTPQSTTHGTALSIVRWIEEGYKCQQ